MKWKVFLAVVGALILMAVLAGSAWACPPGPGGKCYVEGDVYTVVDANLNDPGELVVKKEVTITGDVTVHAGVKVEASAKGIVGKSTAYADAGADFLGYNEVTGPDGSTISQDDTYLIMTDAEYVSDWGLFPSASADAEVVLEYTWPVEISFVPMQEGVYKVELFGDSFAGYYGEAVWKFLWWKCKEIGWDLVYDADRAILYLVAKLGVHDYHGRRVNFVLGHNDGFTVQPWPLPVWGSCAGECANYDGNFPFATFITGVDYTLKLHYPGVEPYVAGIFRTMKKGADIPLDLWLQVNTADGKYYYCNVSLEDGRDYVMSGGMDCE